jgi:hypothetical protein
LNRLNFRRTVLEWNSVVSIGIRDHSISQSGSMILSPRQAICVSTHGMPCIDLRIKGILSGAEQFYRLLTDACAALVP